MQRWRSVARVLFWESPLGSGAAEGAPVLNSGSLDTIEEGESNFFLRGGSRVFEKSPIEY